MIVLPVVISAPTLPHSLLNDGVGVTLIVGVGVKLAPIEVDGVSVGVTVDVGVGLGDTLGSHGPSVITVGSKSGHSDKHGELPNTIHTPPKLSLKHHLVPS